MIHLCNEDVQKEYDDKEIKIPPLKIPNKIKNLIDDNPSELTDIKEYLFSDVFEEIEPEEDWFKGINFNS